MAVFASVWMALGIHAFMLKVARGEEVSARDLLGETALLVPALLATVLVGGAVMLGFGLLIVPGVILSLMFSQFINVMVDRQVGAIESLRLSIQATEGNKVTLLLLGLLMWAVNTAAATLTCGLSTFVVAPFISLMGSVAYLAMTGQTHGICRRKSNESGHLARVFERLHREPGRTGAKLFCNFGFGPLPGGDILQWNESRQCPLCVDAGNCHDYRVRLQRLQEPLSVCPTTWPDCAPSA